MYAENPEMIFIGLLISGLGVYLLFSTLFGKDKQFASIKHTVSAVVLIIIGMITVFCAYTDNMGLMVFSFAFALGAVFAAIGISNLVLYRTCTMKITATYLYSQPVGKRGENAIPMLRYTYEGEEYTSRSRQPVSSKLIGTKYRIDEPCQILINPKKPKINIIRINKKADEIGKIIIGAIFVAGSFAALYFL